MKILQLVKNINKTYTERMHMAMKVTDIKMRRSFSEGSLLAVFSIILEDVLAIHDIKLIKGREKYIIAMPNRLKPDGTHKDIVHPVKPELRKEIEENIINFYENMEK